MALDKLLFFLFLVGCNFLGLVFGCFDLSGDDLTSLRVHLNLSDVRGIRHGDVERPNELAMLFFEFGKFDLSVRTLGKSDFCGFFLVDFGLSLERRLRLISGDCNGQAESRD